MRTERGAIRTIARRSVKCRHYLVRRTWRQQCRPRPRGHRGPLTTRIGLERIGKHDANELRRCRTDDLLRIVGDANIDEQQVKRRDFMQPGARRAAPRTVRATFHPRALPI